jgi:hypothetical protein
MHSLIAAMQEVIAKLVKIDKTIGEWGVSDGDVLSRSVRHQRIAALRKTKGDRNGWLEWGLYDSPTISAQCSLRVKENRFLCNIIYDPFSNSWMGSIVWDDGVGTFPAGLSETITSVLPQTVLAKNEKVTYQDTGEEVALAIIALLADYYANLPVRSTRN